MIERQIPCLLLSFSLMIAARTHICGQGYSPEDAMQHMSLTDGFEASLFAHEPEIRQPIFTKCDDRGRLWTIQYLQYPNPAGLKRVKIDRWSRTVYDRIPEPPPYGPRGADKITICEDSDGDGKADKFTDFVDGLNLVTGVAFGHGGVFVLNVPYLLFYPDRNQDDVPDTDPEVLLTGFGMEDAQSMSNHLTWGPDGWLYGVNGSTTTCNIRGIEFQSGAWRYHPITHEFELFSEGGYNCYGLTFDNNGELFVSTNGGPFIHAMQGAYYYKSFGKHGPLHNLYAYHFFPMLDCDQVPGGPPTGGTVYLGNSFPQDFRGRFIAGNFLGHTCSWWNIQPKGSTFRATFGDVLLDSHDTWFGPTDMCVGPNGSMYVSDFCDQRTAHPDPDANWDLSNGRLYKISYQGQQLEPGVDVSKLSDTQLIDQLESDNGWLIGRILVELANRRDTSVAPRLLEMVNQIKDEQLALHSLWALNAIGQFNLNVANDFLDSPFPYVRFWTTRLLGDNRQVNSSIASKLARIAADESSPQVVAQLAATAKRLPPEYALPIIETLLGSSFLETDERIPWMLWWAIESKSMLATQQLVDICSTEGTWTHQGSRENALRLIRRWSAEGTEAGYQACAELLESAPAKYRQASLKNLRLGLAERAIGLQGIGQGGLFDQQAALDDAPPTSVRQYEEIGGQLKIFIESAWHRQPSDMLTMEIAIRAELDEAYVKLLEDVQNQNTPDALLVQLLQLLQDVGDSQASSTAINLIDYNQSEEVLLAALNVIDTHGSNPSVQSLLDRYLAFSPNVRSRLRDMFFSRAEIAKTFLHQVEQGIIKAEATPISQLSQLASHNDKEIDGLVIQNWGRVGRGSTEEKLATMRRLSNDLRAGVGDLVNGKELFTKHCSICHQLHGQGNRIGPDLTTANRSDTTALLGNIVDPSAVIRREYESYVVLTDSGRAITGLLAEQTPATITVLDAQNRRIKISRGEVEDMLPSDVSLMPERLLEQLTPQELRDLFRYLQQ